MKQFEKSLKTTKIIVILLAAFFAFFLFTGPLIFNWYCEQTENREGVANVLTVVFYACSPSAAITLTYIFKFIKNLDSGFWNNCSFAINATGLFTAAATKNGSIALR